MSYLVVFDSSTWHVDADVLRAALREEWPAAEMQPPAPHIVSEVGDVHWFYRTEDAIVEAYTAKDGTCLYLKGGIGLVVKFAIWYRKLVPEDIDVIFCDDSYSFDGVVTPDSTESELVELAG
ncbi:hypothetical protein [Lentzea terrae]|uniref:hypothetical protein n=1 Tax=Lentzea terrae TaxID=2200761 RepID=UPI000DD42CD8|nr:hypothetical protein [Lentzea terrae]